MDFEEGKRYRTFTGYYKRLYGERLQKLVIDAGFSCPNRDGTIGFGGCAYCDNAAFHPGYSTPGKSVTEQIDEGITFHRGRYPRVKRYLAYFQAYSNTYGTLEKMRRVYEEALSHPAITGIVIGTRPDCVDDEKLDYLESLAKDKVVVVEYGIESCLDKTLLRINRGHDFATARAAVEATSKRGIDVGAHFILGLPGESREEILSQCETISSLPLLSVKFHQLQIVKGTRMEKEYAERPEDFEKFGLDEYIDFMVDMLERLRPDLYIERIAGEVPPRFVNETPWGLIRNPELLHKLDKRLEERDTFQGRLWKGWSFPRETGDESVNYHAYLL